MNDYVFKRSEDSPAALAQYAKLLAAAFPKTGKLTVSYLKWLYSNNPVGKVFGYDAYYNDVLVAHYATIPVLYNIKNKDTKGLLSLNTATDKDHRGKGLFTMLAKKTFEDVALTDFKFVIGVANNNSAHGFITNLGFQLISPLDVKTGIGSVEVNPDASYTVKASRSTEFLQWRLSNPSCTYFRKDIYILSKADKYGFDAQLAQTKNIPEKVPLVKKKYTLLTVWIGLCPAIKKRGIFFNLPNKLKPSPLLLIFKDLTGNIGTLTKDDFFFELIDFDAY
jgi:hypothetical protein